MSNVLSDEESPERMVGDPGDLTRAVSEPAIVIEDDSTSEENFSDDEEHVLQLHVRGRTATAIVVQPDSDDESKELTGVEKGEETKLTKAPPPQAKLTQNRFMVPVHAAKQVLVTTSLPATREQDLDLIYKYIEMHGDDRAIRLYNVMGADDLPDERFPEELVHRDFGFSRDTLLNFTKLCAFTKSVADYINRDPVCALNTAVVVCDEDEVACWLSLLLLLQTKQATTAIGALDAVKKPIHPVWTNWIMCGGWNAVHTTYLNYFVAYSSAYTWKGVPFPLDKDFPAITMNAFELSAVSSNTPSDLLVYIVLRDGDNQEIYRYRKPYNRAHASPSGDDQKQAHTEPAVWAAPHTDAPHTLALRSRVAGDVHAAVYASPDGNPCSWKNEGLLLGRFSFHTSFLPEDAKDSLVFAEGAIASTSADFRFAVTAQFAPISQLEQSTERVQKKKETWKSLTNAIRGLVSKKKLRFQREGFDLDLSYITESIIAMGFPSESVEALYRNKMTDVQRFFTKFHPDQFKVYNLCSERKYKAERFDHMVGYFPFDDHNPPPFTLLPKICQDILEFLDQDPDNVVAIHCKAGKGRTGTVIACLLLYQHVAVKAKDALQFFGLARTSNGAGVTIPSQQRYVRYMERFLSEYENQGRDFPYFNTPVEIKGFKLFGEVKGLGDISPMFIVSSSTGEVLYQSEPHNKYKPTAGDAEPWCELDCSTPVDGDFKVAFYHRYKSEKMCSFWVHTTFLMPPNFKEDWTGEEPEVQELKTGKLVLRIKRSGLDNVANKDKKMKKFAKDFAIEMEYSVLFGKPRQDVFDRFEKQRVDKLAQEMGSRHGGKGLVDKIKGLVSKKKLRFQTGGYDLDLSYITERVIAMGFPSKSFEGLYRNNVRDVQRFFFERHSAHYKVYNLCSERSYDNKKFHLVCHDFKFDDHNPCPLEMIPGLCEDVTKFLSSSESNVVAIHCKAGKGRTGLMIACLLLHTKEAATAQEALECFANKRTANGKGVTIPSQIRYVHYYEQCLASLSSGHRLTEKTELVITGLRMTHAIAWSYSGESDPYYVVQRNHNKSKYSYLRQHGDLGVKKWTKKEPYRDLRIHCLVTNDFKMVFYDRDVISADDKMFWCWLNADMLSTLIDPDTNEGTLTLSKQELDGAVKDKSHSVFHADFTLELRFSRAVGHYEEKAHHARHARDSTAHFGIDPKERKSAMLDQLKEGSDSEQGQMYRRSVLLNDIKGSSHGSGLLATVRGVVSKKKRRFQRDGFDLDLTYILPNVIAMGAPSRSISGLYRNNMKDVQNFFSSYHDGNYKVYNLCAEYQYDANAFGGSVAVFPFQDHNPPKFEDLVKICEDTDEFVTDDDDNVVAIHCKAGKGRTGTVIACHLLFQRTREDATEALAYFGAKRTTDAKGVTIPSQARYVAYFDEYLRNYRWRDLPFNFKGPVVTIQNVRLTSPPTGGMLPFFVIEGPSTTKHKDILYDMKKDPLRQFKVQEWKKRRTHDIECDVRVQADFKMVLYDKEEGFGDDQKIGWLWLNTCFLTQKGKNSIKFTKRMIDGAVKDKNHRKTPIDFTIEIFYAYDPKYVRLDLDERLLAAQRKSVTYCANTPQTIAEGGQELKASADSSPLPSINEEDSLVSALHGGGVIDNDAEEGNTQAFDTNFGYQKKVMLKEGYGSKRGKGVMASWQKRYFVLFDQMLVYYKSMEDYRRGQIEPLGSIPIFLMRNVVKHKERDLIISLVAAEEYKNKESLRIRCLNFVMRDQWVSEMRELVTFDSPDCEGFVRKQHKEFSRVWQKRYLKLDSKAQTLSYSDNKTSSVSGTILLTDLVGVNKAQPPQGQTRLTKKLRSRFEVHVAQGLTNYSRDFSFWAETAFLAAEWVRKIIAASPQLQKV